MEKVLRLVAEGAITPEEADELLARLDNAAGAVHEGATGEDGPASRATSRDGERRLRIEVHEGGRRVVNLSIPLNVAGLAGTFLPGLSEEISERVQSAIHAGLRGHIVDVTSDDGDRVLIVSE